ENLIVLENEATSVVDTDETASINSELEIKGLDPEVIHAIIKGNKKFKGNFDCPGWAFPKNAERHLKSKGKTNLIGEYTNLLVRAGVFKYKKDAYSLNTHINEIEDELFRRLVSIYMPA
ncbi:MAG: hypothetical protein AABY07_07645, partial [Nanoarchaeota archaeon]